MAQFKNSSVSPMKMQIWEKHRKGGEKIETRGQSYFIIQIENYTFHTWKDSNNLAK